MMLEALVTLISLPELTLANPGGRQKASSCLGTKYQGVSRQLPVVSLNGGLLLSRRSIRGGLFRRSIDLLSGQEHRDLGGNSPSGIDGQ